MSTGQKPKPKNPSNLKPFLLFLKGYLPLTLLMLIVSASASLISLFLPSKIGQLIDSYKIQGYQGVGSDYYFLGGVVVGVFLLSLIQVYFSNFFAEKIAFDLRKSIMTKVADQSYQYVNEVGSSSLITAVTSDVDNTKFVISNGIVAVLTSIILLVGSSTVMLITNLRLGLIAVGTLPFIFIAFGLIFSRIGKLFGLIQANTTKLNQVISESVYAAALVRVMNSKGWEMQKFQIFNQKAKELTYRIVFLFSALFPAINLITNSAIVAIIWFGGRGIVESQISGINQFTVGGLSAFLSYYTLLITPVFILGFTSQAISRGLVSFGNIQKIIQSTTTEHLGMYQGLVKGNILVKVRS